MSMALVAACPSGCGRRRPDHQEKDSVMEYGPLVPVLSLSLMLTVLGVGIASELSLP
jgi:hypothetical protein